MKTFLPALFCLLLLISCEKEAAPTGILGEWQLIAILADPGDGSGEFRPVDSEKRITFFENGNYSSNGLICEFTQNASGSAEGNYTSTEEGYQIECPGVPGFPINLRIENGFLLVSYPCIEPCMLKFRKRS